MSRVVSKRLARQVQARANFMCEYCKLPDFLAFASFEIDHIIAKQHQGGSGLENLAWSIFDDAARQASFGFSSCMDPTAGAAVLAFALNCRREAKSQPESPKIIIDDAARQVSFGF